MKKTINKIAIYFLTKEPKKILKKIKETKSLKNFGKQKAEKYYKEQKEYIFTKTNKIIFEFYDNKFSNLLKDLKFLFEKHKSSKNFFDEIDITDEDKCEQEIIELSLKDFIEEKLNNGNLEIEDFYKILKKENCFLYKVEELRNLINDLNSEDLVSKINENKISERIECTEDDFIKTGYEIFKNVKIKKGITVDFFMFGKLKGNLNTLTIEFDNETEEKNKNDNLEKINACENMIVLKYKDTEVMFPDFYFLTPYCNRQFPCKIKIKFGDEMKKCDFTISNYYHCLRELEIERDWDESEFKENVITKTIFCLLRNALKYLYSNEYDDFTYSLPIFKNKFEESYGKFANNEIRSYYNIRKIVLDIYDRIFSSKEKRQIKLEKLKNTNILKEFYGNNINSLLKDLFYLFDTSEFIQISKKLKEGDIVQNSENFFKEFIGNVLLKKKFVFNKVKMEPEYYFEMLFQEESNRELNNEKEIKKYYEAREKRLEKNKNE